MALCLAAAHLRPSPNPYLDSAWHIVAVLLRLGRPAHPSELAEECSDAIKFPISADFIEFFCWLEGSPLSRTVDGLITLSARALKAAAGFAMQGRVSILPPMEGGRLKMARIWVGSEVGRYFNRKRQGSVLLPPAKRRTLLLRYDHDGSKSKDDAGLAPGPNEADSDETAKGTLLDSNAESERIILENGSERLLDHNLNSRFENITTALCELEKPDKDGKFCSFPSNTIRRKSVKLEQVTPTEDQENTNDAKPAHRDCFQDKFDDSRVQLETCERKDEEDATAGVCYRRTRSRLRLDADSNTMLHTSTTIGNKDGDFTKDKADATAGVCYQRTRSRSRLNSDSNTMLHTSTTVGNNDGESTKPEAERPLQDHIPSRMGLTNAPPTSTTAPRHLSQDEVAIAPDSVGVEDFGSLCNKQENTVLHQDPFLLNKKAALKTSKVKQNDPIKDIAPDSDAKLNEFPVSKKLPLFDSFIVEEEEGSGGYGTVYRAKRKNDGKVFAIKCPHVNARSSHVENERKMLERFGGRSFVIKYEGSFKSGSSECFILEHVAHDRPELLKKDIDLIELQWYGYCMFRALASLHKQGVVHKDVKPGNFLFSRVLNKGYLIDFNLAADLHHKPRTSSIVNLQAKEGLFKSPIRKPDLPTLPRKPVTNSKESLGHGQKGPNKILNKPMKKSTIKDGFGGYPDKETRHTQTNKGADGSGLSSVRDVTSIRTPSVERSKEPLPSRGRKELLNLAQEVLRSPNQKAMPPPVSQRKRVSAPLGRADRISALLTPMPLLCSGVPISGGEQVKNKGRKPKNEGPCVGTKGFRAPEVLFRSLYQGCKVDTWSAGVTILYMILGRTPFGGEPEQNIKEIARLRGSEDLWEVAKLHNRESSFPSELFDIQFLASTGLRQWCEKNTKRPDFFRKMPNSLFDLVDKCLKVNPRSRIGAEEALMHDFFLPCRESLRRQRSLRQTRDSELESQV